MAQTQFPTLQEQIQNGLASSNPNIHSEAVNLQNYVQAHGIDPSLREPPPAGSQLTPEQKQQAIQFDTASSDPEMQAQGQYLQTGQVAKGYHVDPNTNNIVKNPSLMDKVSGSVGIWGPILVGSVAGGLGLAGALSSGAGAGAAIPSIPTTTGLAAPVGVDVTAAGTAIPGAIVPSIATTTGLAAPVGVDVTGAGTSLPTAGGGIGSTLSKIINPKGLAQNAIKGLTSRSGQQQNSSQQLPQAQAPQVAQASPAPPPNFSVSPTTSMPGGSSIPSMVNPNSYNIQTGPALGEQNPTDIYQQLLSRYNG